MGLFRIRVEGQKQLVSFPNGEKFPLVTKTIAEQDVEMMKGAKFCLTFNFLSSGKHIKFSDAVAVDIEKQTLTSPSGAVFNNVHIQQIEAETEDKANEFSAQVWAIYDHEKSYP